MGGIVANIIGDSSRAARQCSLSLLSSLRRAVLVGYSRVHLVSDTMNILVFVCQLVINVLQFLLGLFGPNKIITYARLPDETVFPPIVFHTPASSTSRHTVPYSAHTLANAPPLFSFCDKELGPWALARYKLAIQHLGVENRTCPRAVEPYWRLLVGHINDNVYNGEPWVGTVMDAVAFLLKLLLHDILPAQRVVIEYPVLWASQRGDRNLVVKNGDDKTNGIGQEFKTSPVLEYHDHGFSEDHFLQPGIRLENEQAVLAKMGLHIDKMIKEKNPNARFGIITSAVDCYVVERAETTIYNRTVHGIAISERIPLSPASHEGSRSASAITLHLGLLIPPDVISYHEPRDPSRHAGVQQWTKLKSKLSKFVTERDRLPPGGGEAADGGGAGLRRRRGTGGTHENDVEGNGEEGKG
ncbi:hypothetical protein B0H19DRAFT_645759 [Mycena capillaripes]|nr:hypothetical protein B0H19DRAFT_645759 [Mycena capillaripes]